MTTPEALCADKGIDLVYFDGRESKTKGIYNKNQKVIAIDSYLDDHEKKKVIYHELGHEDHDPNQYDRRREQYELQADRTMIHLLLKEELQVMEDNQDFNYVRFLEKYQLKTVANEVAVKEEYLNLINELSKGE